MIVLADMNDRSTGGEQLSCGDGDRLKLLYYNSNNYFYNLVNYNIFYFNKQIINIKLVVFKLYLSWMHL